METLMHTCCAPCSVSCIRQLRGEGIEPVSFWYNPNIHPYQEYKARRDTLMAYAPAIGMKLIVREDYGLRDFCRAVCGDIDHRCGHCYHIRLWETARYAAEHGYASFTSTLFGRGIRGRVPVPGFPSRIPGRPAGGPGAWLLHAEILRVRVQRGGPLPQAARPGSEKSGKDHWITAAPPVTRRGCC